MPWTTFLTQRPPRDKNTSKNVFKCLYSHSFCQPITSWQEKSESRKACLTLINKWLINMAACVYCVRVLHHKYYSARQSFFPPTLPSFVALTLKVLYSVSICVRAAGWASPCGHHSTLTWTSDFGRLHKNYSNSPKQCISSAAPTFISLMKEQCGFFSGGSQRMLLQLDARRVWHETNAPFSPSVFFFWLDND